MTEPYRTTTGIGSKDRSGPETSREAAEKHAAGFRELRERIFETIRGAQEDGLTSDEVAALLDCDVLAVRPRISELKELGRVVPNGDRRPSSRQNLQQVLVATQFAPPADAAPPKPEQGSLL